ncbi:hypothetical protein TURU_158163 [Turdus rufiventris]|nr:hypothetical protein TURU_158163 [Turdus rufiventris]
MSCGLPWLGMAGDTVSFEIDVECIICAIHALLFSLGNFPRKYFVSFSQPHHMDVSDVLESVGVLGYSYLLCVSF